MLEAFLAGGKFSLISTARKKAAKCSKQRLLRLQPAQCLNQPRVTGSEKSSKAATNSWLAQCLNQPRVTGSESVRPAPAGPSRGTVFEPAQGYWENTTPAWHYSADVAQCLNQPGGLPGAGRISPRTPRPRSAQCLNQPRVTGRSEHCFAVGQTNLEQCLNQPRVTGRCAQRRR